MARRGMGGPPAAWPSPARKREDEDDVASDQHCARRRGRGYFADFCGFANFAVLMIFTPPSQPRTSGSSSLRVAMQRSSCSVSCVMIRGAPGIDENVCFMYAA